MNARLNGSDAFSPADGLELEHRKRWSTSKLQVAIFYFASTAKDRLVGKSAIRAAAKIA